MRLKEKEIQAIKDSVFQFDPEAKIHLFGSRADESQRGGDIDLLILSDTITNKEKRKIIIKLQDKIGAQKIDIIVVKSPETQFEKSIYEHSIPL